MGWFKKFAQGIAEKATGGIIDSGFGALQSWQNFQYGEKAAQAADRRQREQFKDMYSLEAQMQQIKNAGLSPSMFFSGGLSGQGGANAPQGAGASGPIFNSSPINALSAAQIEALQEDTRGKKIENDNKQAAIDADIALKLSQAGLYKASKAFTNVQKEREQIALEIDKATTEDQKNEIRSRAKEMYYESWLTYYESRSARAHAEVDEATIKTRIATEIANNQKIISSIALDLSTITKNESSIAVDKTTIEKMITEIAINSFNAKTDRLSYEAQKEWFRNQIHTQLLNILKDLGINEEQISTQKLGYWLNFATSIVGTACNMFGASMIANKKGF